MVIQYLLLAAVLGFLVMFVRSKHGVRMRASKRLAFFAFLAVNAYAVLRPNDVTRVAHLVGVGRGTDLLLYILIVTFIFAMTNFYLRLQAAERRVTDLARATAIYQAELVNRDRGLLPPDTLGDQVADRTAQ